MWNLIEFTDFDSEHKEEDDDDDDQDGSPVNATIQLRFKIRPPWRVAVMQMAKNTIHLSQERVGLLEFLHHRKSQL